MWGVREHKLQPMPRIGSSRGGVCFEQEEKEVEYI